MEPLLPKDEQPQETDEDLSRFPSTPDITALRGFSNRYLRNPEFCLLHLPTSPKTSKLLSPISKSHEDEIKPIAFPSNPENRAKEVTKFTIKFFLTFEQINPLNERHQQGEKKLEPEVKPIFDAQERTSEYLYQKAITLNTKWKNNPAIDYIAATILTNSLLDDEFKTQDFSLVFDLFSKEHKFNKLYKATVWNEALEHDFKQVSLTPTQMKEMQLEFLKSIDWNLRLLEMNLVDN